MSSASASRSSSLSSSSIAIPGYAQFGETTLTQLAFLRGLAPIGSEKETGRTAAQSPCSFAIAFTRLKRRSPSFCFITPAALPVIELMNARVSSTSPSDGSGREKR